MSKSDLNDFNKDFEYLLNHIKQIQQQVYKQVNAALIELYWNIGKHLSEKTKNEGWGKGTVSLFAQYMQENSPEIKGFSDKNLWRMKQFYETYEGNEKLSTLLRELSWSHNLSIFSRCKTKEEREFYLKLSVHEKYSFRELDRQMSAGLFERTMLSNAKLSTVLRELQPSVNQIFKDKYILEFLNLPEVHTENDLQKAIVLRMKSFILELGKDFIFMDEEYRLQVGNQDFYIDLLFYHRGLSALVAFELKIGNFLPEHLGQLNFYL